MTMPKCPKDGKPCNKLRREMELSQKWKALAEKAKALNDETLGFLHEVIKREHAFIAILVFEAFIILALLVFLLGDNHETGI